MTHRETLRLPVPDQIEGRPVTVPLYQTANFAFDDPAAMASAMSSPSGAHFYSGYTNPTSRALEEAVTALEGGTVALATASGMGAISASLFGALRHGDHVIAQKAVYGGTSGLLNNLATQWGVEVTWIAGHDLDEFTAALRPNSRVLLLETIANPTGYVPDLPNLLGAAHSAGLTTIVDNTFATPMLCRPIEYGADVVVHSATKYLGGHHDLVAGVAVFAEREPYEKAWAQAIKLGSVIDPFTAWLTLRGLKTLPLRVQRQVNTASDIAHRLAAHPAVSVVHHPGLPSHPSHRRASRLLSGYGGTLSFEVAGAEQFMGQLGLILNAGSLGGTETVAMHPASTTHRHLRGEALRATGVTPDLVRLSFGLEHPDDLWADIEQALKSLPG
ncbi:aminotransferase class I/II-fold pyridoxal phosphate-dependent enzyme [Amycolatopsis acidicola]|uniref:homocysteine desulfhydrase n=1 Tax=Amycolatopsis acidicola TaxID=2596893 RepID=A0A5N0V5T6_9PSEU|nr:aminotransferase class I/II-fold pyridoxal phosphate-dependent enzyme [Amycolatopsis acidicola]KAA9161355.1 aminotransferase class I/II-fold pyridoxal phosphate-dependent enzyme [Amycolatopsis acidicola]